MKIHIAKSAYLDDTKAGKIPDTLPAWLRNDIDIWFTKYAN